MNSIKKSLVGCCLPSSTNQPNPKNTQEKEDIKPITYGFGFNPPGAKDTTPPLVSPPSTESTEEIENISTSPSRLFMSLKQDLVTIPEDQELV